MATARTAAASSRGCFSRVASTRGAAPSPRPRHWGGRFTKDRFDVDLLSGTVTCPAGTTVAAVDIRACRCSSSTAADAAAGSTADGPLDDHTAGGTAVHAITPTERRAIVELFERWGASTAATACASARTRPCSPRRAPANKTPHGETTTAPCAPKSNASSRTSCAETRRPPRPRARSPPGQSRRRLQPAGRSRQHRAPRRARTALDTTAMDGPSAEPPSARPPPDTDPTSPSTPPHTTAPDPTPHQHRRHRHQHTKHPFGTSHLGR